MSHIVNVEPKNGASWLNDKQTMRVCMFILQDGLCAYCGAQMELHPAGAIDRLATVDHILPRRLGGSNDRLNKVLCCRNCNRTKGDGMPDLLRRIADVQERLIEERGLAQSGVKDCLTTAGRVGEVRCGG